MLTPQPGCVGSNQVPVSSTSLTMPDWMKGAIAMVPAEPSRLHLIVAASGALTVSRSVPTCAGCALAPFQRYLARGQSLPMSACAPCAVYQTGWPALSYVYQTTITCPATLNM